MRRMNRRHASIDGEDALQELVHLADTWTETESLVGSIQSSGTVVAKSSQLPGSFEWLSMALGPTSVVEAQPVEMPTAEPD